MKIDQTIIAAVKAKQTKELAEAHLVSRGAFDLDQALAAAQKRLEAAIAIAEELGAVTPFGTDRGAFIVGNYLVTSRASVVGCGCALRVHCQCDDHKHRKGRCKHILAAGLVVRTKGGADE